MAGGRAESLSLAAAGAVVALLVVVPLVAVATRADTSSLGVLTQGRAWVLLGRSIVLATSVTVGALVIGIPCGAVFARARVPALRSLFALHLAPVFLPPFFAALGWFHLFGARASGSSVLFSPAGAWAVLTFAFAPIVTGLTAIGIRALDPSLEEAARLVARPWRVVTRILVPAAGRQIAIGGLIVFALTLGELGAPMFLRVDVYPAAVFARLGGMDLQLGEAAVLSLPIVALAALLVAGEARLFGRSHAGALTLRDRARESLDLGPGAHALAIAAALVSMTPLLVLAGHGMREVGRVGEWLGSSIANGLLASLATATVATLGGLGLGHALGRGRWMARIVTTALLFGFFVPSAVLGVGIVAAWNRPSTEVVYGSAGILVLAFLARYSWLSIRVIAAFVAQRSSTYEEAAAVAGAGYFRRLARVVAPMERRGLVLAFGLTLVFCLRDLETAVLLYPPGGEPLTVRIFTLEANGPTRVVAALAVVHVAVTLAALLVVGWGFRGSRA
ncbi:MAG: iron ABC transporter permease [Myxococcales bacterium]|nr:iron ABC transporter permease [Myxococcales bacterium]